jgi:hypothetical protein
VSHHIFRLLIEILGEMFNLVGGIDSGEFGCGVHHGFWAHYYYFLCLTLKYPSTNITIFNLILREIKYTLMNINVYFRVHETIRIPRATLI